MRRLSFLQAERLRRYPCKNIAFAQAFLYLSSYPETHLIVRIQLESAPVGDQSSGPVRHEKSGPLEIPRSASFLRACSTILEIGRCPRKNNTDCHLAAAVSHADEKPVCAVGHAAVRAAAVSRAAFGTVCAFDDAGVCGRTYAGSCQTEKWHGKHRRCVLPAGIWRKLSGVPAADLELGCGSGYILGCRADINTSNSKYKKE